MVCLESLNKKQAARPVMTHLYQSCDVRVWVYVENSRLA